MRILLLSTYEMGHQPLGLARPAAVLTQGGHEVACLDLAVQHVDEEMVRCAELIGISVPMHTATRLAKPLAARLRRLNPRAHICFYGLYASLNADGLLGRYADTVIGGEFDEPLLALANQLDASLRAAPRGTGTGGARSHPAGEGEDDHARRSSWKPLDASSDAAQGAGRDHSTPFPLPRAGRGGQATDAPLRQPGEHLTVGHQEDGLREAVRDRNGRTWSENEPGPRDEPRGARTVEGVIDAAGGGAFLGRQKFVVPRRNLLPPLDRYARLDDGHEEKLTGYVEASHGCAHQCLHCPITPVYGGRLRIVQPEVVLADIRQLVDMGARHITFGDPDFFNGVKHSTRILQAMHAEFPGLTFDATIKVEHLIEHRSLLPLLKETGCAFVVSAVESIDDRVLAILRKGHSAADVEIALGLTREAGLILRPTFVAFTPWTSLQGYVDLLEFVERLGLIRHVDPIQYAIRLLIPRGSSLLGTPAVEGLIGEFDPETLTYFWKHPDPRVDALQRQISEVVESAMHEGTDAFTAFYRVKERALSALRGRPVEVAAPAVLASSEPVPRLTEPWFC